MPDGILIAVRSGAENAGGGVKKMGDAAGQLGEE
jgi:hypothetical protein